MREYTYNGDVKIATKEECRLMRDGFGEMENYKKTPVEFIYFCDLFSEQIFRKRCLLLRLFMRLLLLSNNSHNTTNKTKMGSKEIKGNPHRNYEI